MPAFRIRVTSEVISKGKAAASCDRWFWFWFTFGPAIGVIGEAEAKDGLIVSGGGP